MLSQHPANLLLRFFLEVVALVAAGRWGWQAGGDSPSPAGRFVLAFGLPLLLASLWAIFRAPDDSTQPAGKKPIVAVPGKVRLAIELFFFGFALWAMFSTGQVLLGGAMLIALLLHHLWSADRLLKLWKGQ